MNLGALTPGKDIRMLTLPHSMLVHKLLVVYHSLRGVFLVEVSNKALLGSKGLDDRVLDRNRHFDAVPVD